MILFWLIATILIVIALAFVIPPLLQRDSGKNTVTDLERKEANLAVYRDQLSELKADLENGIISQEQYELDTEEIQRRLLEDVSVTTDVKKDAPPQSRGMAYLVALGIPLIAVLLYLKVGTPPGISQTPRPAINGPMMSGGPRTQEEIAANVEKLAQRLKENPNDASGWAMLARSYSSMDRFGEAAGAYAKATELNPNDADLWADYAFVTAMANGRKIDANTLELIKRALSIDPENVKALQLAGTAAFDTKDYKKAVEIWERILKRVPPGSEVAQALTERINEAKTLSGSK